MKIYTIKKNENDSYTKTMDYFSRHFFGDWIGEDFLCKLGEYLDNVNFPSNRLVVDPYGYDDRFAITFKYDNERICYIQLEMNIDTKILQLHNASFEEKLSEKIFLPKIKEYLKEYNVGIFKKQLERCGIKSINFDNAISIDDYDRYVLKEEKVILKGTIGKIFDDYTTHNDRYRYCNGTHWKFTDRNVSRLYSMFIGMYDGNYFLDNAVRRGVTID